MGRSSRVEIPGSRGAPTADIAGQRAPADAGEMVHGGALPGKAEDGGLKKYQSYSATRLTWLWYHIPLICLKMMLDYAQAYILYLRIDSDTWKQSCGPKHWASENAGQVHTVSAVHLKLHRQPVWCVRCYAGPKKIGSSNCCEQRHDNPTSRRLDTSTGSATEIQRSLIWVF